MMGANRRGPGGLAHPVVGVELEVLPAVFLAEDVEGPAAAVREGPLPPFAHVLHGQASLREIAEPAVKRLLESLE